MHDEAKRSVMAYRGASVLGLDVRLELSPGHCGAYIFDYRWCRCHNRTAGLSHRPSEAWLVGQRSIDRFEANVERASANHPLATVGRAAKLMP